RGEEHRAPPLLYCPDLGDYSVPFAWNEQVARTVIFRSPDSYTLTAIVPGSRNAAQSFAEKRPNPSETDIRMPPSPTKIDTTCPPLKPVPQTMYCWPSVTGFGSTQHFSFPVGTTRLPLPPAAPLWPAATLE